MSFTVSQQLWEVKEWDTLCKQLCNHTTYQNKIKEKDVWKICQCIGFTQTENYVMVMNTSWEDVHGLLEFSSGPLAIAGEIHKRSCLVIFCGKHTAIHKSLRCNVARSPPGRVEEVVEICRVVFRQVCRFKTSKVCEKHPVPACHHNILCFNVTMTHTRFMGLVYSIEELEGDPLLLHIVEERSRADTVIQVIPNILPK